MLGFGLDPMGILETSLIFLLVLSWRTNDKRLDGRDYMVVMKIVWGGLPYLQCIIRMGFQGLRRRKTMDVN